MSNPLINIGVPVVILDTAVAVAAGNTYALPNRTCVLGWQTSFDVNPATIALAIQVAMNEDGPWIDLDTSTTVTPAFKTISTPTAARFVRANIVDNDSVRAVTIELVCKVAVP